jgi:hypothetical protein
MNIRRSIISAAMAGLFTATSFGSAFGAGNIPFKILRGSINANGTVFAGGAGFTVNPGGGGRYKVVFPVGTWNNGNTACFFVSQVQAMFTTAVAQITELTTSADGSGIVNINISSGVDTPLNVVFTSANC